MEKNVRLIIKPKDGIVKTMKAYTVHVGINKIIDFAEFDKIIKDSKKKAAKLNKVSTHELSVTFSVKDGSSIEKKISQALGPVTPQEMAQSRYVEHAEIQEMMETEKFYMLMCLMDRVGKVCKSCSDKSEEFKKGFSYGLATMKQMLLGEINSNRSISAKNFIDKK